MNTNNLDRLADELAAGLTPAKALRHPLLRAMNAFSLAVLWVTASILFVGIRPDFAAMLEQEAYIAELLFALMVAGTAAAASSWLAVPGRRGQGVAVAVPLVLTLFFTFLLGMQAAREGFRIPAPELLRCPVNGLLMAAVPVAAFVILTRWGTTTRPYLAALMNILAVAGLGWAGLRVTCWNDQLSHTFFYHFLPFAAAGGVLGALARRLYRW